tara:strand:- start:725 stop:1624 length:900 start_codon:yes stop_codon:yes gene_type:complete
MHTKPFFSIVVTTYNSENFIKRALSSIFSQTYQNFEIIIVDNSSTDNTKKIIQDFSQDKIRFFEVKNDGVIGYSRNKGINHSNADWIAFLDSDDTWEPKKLDIVKQVIEKNPNIILACHNEWHIFNNSKKELQHGPYERDMYKKLVFDGNCLSTSAVTLRRDIAIKVKGFSERKDFITTEDYEFWIRLSKEGKFFFIDEILGSWYAYKGSESSKINIHANALLSVMEYHLNLWQQIHKKDAKKIKMRKSKVYLSIALMYLKDQAFKNAARFAKKSIKLNLFQIKSWVVLLLSFLKIKII